MEIDVKNIDKNIFSNIVNMTFGLLTIDYTYMIVCTVEELEGLKFGLYKQFITEFCKRYAENYNLQNLFGCPLPVTYFYDKLENAFNMKFEFKIPEIKLHEIKDKIL